jgi:hypothetical protein
MREYITTNHSILNDWNRGSNIYDSKPGQQSPSLIPNFTRIYTRRNTCLIFVDFGIHLNAAQTVQQYRVIRFATTKKEFPSKHVRRRIIPRAYIEKRDHNVYLGNETSIFTTIGNLFALHIFFYEFSVPQQVGWAYSWRGVWGWR